MVHLVKKNIDEHNMITISCHINKVVVENESVV